MSADEVKTFLTRLLKEAPGHASDIAAAIRIPNRLVERSLEELSNDGLAERVTDTSGTWYRWAADPM
ncbi:helix-turn-helix domain-containing protein [Microbacterium sp. P5_E9]